MPVRKTKSSVFDRKCLGDEPKVTKSSIASEIINAYNWLNYFYSTDEAKDFVISYLKHKKMDKAFISKVAEIDSIKLRTVGWNCYLLHSGSELPLDIETKMWHKLHMLISQVRQKKVSVKVVSIKQHIENKSSDIIGDIECVIDDIANGVDTNFNIEDFFRNKNIKPVIAKQIIDYYKPVYSEIFDAVKSNDPELKYAYRNWKPKKLKKLLEFLSSIMAMSDVYTVKVVKARKLRKKKEKPADVLVSKLQYKKEDTSYKIKSVSSVSIIGAQQLWLFNTKYRYLTVLDAMSPVGLSVKGTTVTGFDEKISQTKMLRKPDAVLSNVLNGGKIVLKKLMSTIKCKTKKITGRINNDVIILRVIK
jgi:hypothetical protein